MKRRTSATVSLLLLASLAVTAALSQQSNLEALYEKAFHEFDSKHYDEALKALDQIDARQPDLAESLNLRGVVLMRQGKFDQAEKALRKAISLDPRFWNASFNLAEIPFRKKEWVEARNRFESLMGSRGAGMQPETSQLIQYKILLTFVRQGKENTVDWMLNKFESAKDSPALYYSNAAIAFQHGNEREAKEWLAEAKKKFSASLDRLYSESLYEIGWIEKPTGEARTGLEITSADERLQRLKADAKANFEKAERAFQRRDFVGAAKSLDLAEEDNPNEPAFANLRGEILMGQGKLDEAEAVFRKVLAVDPKSREVQYNLAEVPFKKGDYAKARERFETLFAETPGDERNRAVQLIKYKIYMTLLLEGKDPEAQQLMNQFKFTGETPALYYAHAAWEFKHGKTGEGNDWVASAEKIYPSALNQIFADSLFDLGWLAWSESEAGSITSALAQVAASAKVQPPPAMRLGLSESLSAPEASPESRMKTETAAAVAETATTPNETAASNKVVAARTPAALTVPAIQPTAKPLVAASSATALAPEQGRIWRKRNERTLDLRMLLVPGSLLAGILLLAWLVVLPFRRSRFTTQLYRSAEPLTQPPSSDELSPPDDQLRVRGDLISSGPPQVSLNLKASEPSLRAPVSPFDSITALSSRSGVDEPVAASPEEAEKSVSEAVPAPVTGEKIPAEVATGSLRDKKEVSLSAEVPPAAPEIREVEPVAAAEVTAAEVPSVRTPAAETPIAEVTTVAAPEASAFETPIEVATPAYLAIAPLAEESIVPEALGAADAAGEEPLCVEEEPVGQGQPVPELTTAFSAEPVISELSQPEPGLVSIEPEDAIAIPITDNETVEPSFESASIAPKIPSREPGGEPRPKAPFGMPDTPITPGAPAARPSSSAMSVVQPAGGLHTAVQLTFFLEIASMQLTPTFKISGLQLKPISKVISMRLAPSNDPQAPVKLQSTFELAKISLSDGVIGSAHLVPSAREKPGVLTSPSLAISGLDLIAGAGGTAPVQLTPLRQEQASVRLTAHFQIATIEFTPLFEIEAIVLNSTSRDVIVQLPGSGSSSIENAPIFQIISVQLNGSDIEVIQVVPRDGNRSGA